MAGPDDQAVAAQMAPPASTGYGQPAVSPADSVRQAWTARIGAALVGLGVVLGIIGLFPVYTDGASLASETFNLVPHVIYLAAWVVSGALLLAAGRRRQVGALLGLGVSAVTFGMFLADAGTPITSGAHLMGAGLILSFIGWFVCTAGVAVGLLAADLAVRRWPAFQRGARRQYGRPASHEVVPITTMIVAAIGAAVAFAPSWDSFLLRTTTGASQTVTAGNAFANPAAVISGDVLVMVLFVAALVVAALWRPLRLGAALAAGALVPMVAQAISAIIEIGQPTSPLYFGVSPSQARVLGLTITNGLTAIFWVYCAFLGTLILLGIWMLLNRDHAPEQAVTYRGQPYYWPSQGAYSAGSPSASGGYVPAATGGAPANSAPESHGGAPEVNEGAPEVNEGAREMSEDAPESHGGAPAGGASAAGASGPPEPGDPDAPDGFTASAHGYRAPQ